MERDAAFPWSGRAYALLTGEYPWRKKGTGILPGDAQLIIQPGRTTVASMLQRAGYTTGVVGKWHLGLGGKGGPDWNGEIKPGPREVGFDYSFLMPATGDRVPCVYGRTSASLAWTPGTPSKSAIRHPRPACAPCAQSTLCRQERLRRPRRRDRPV